MKKILFLFLIYNTVAFSQTKTITFTENDKTEVDTLIKEFNKVLEKYYPNQKLGMYVFKLNWTFAKRVFS